jgi:predicted O-methyltransferase YrrM
MPNIDQRWTDVDEYLADALLGADPALDDAVRANEEAQLPPIDVTPMQGKLLHLLARATGARRVLELGTLGGYSTIWLARAVGPKGRVITLEREAKHAEVARRNLERAGVADRVEIRLGVALDSLAALAAERVEPFDFVFIDADKRSMAEYMDWAIRLSRPGALIIGDNVIREGAVTDPSSTDENVIGVRALFDALATDRRVSATAIQTVGRKGYDGFTLAVVLDPSERR